MTNNSAKRMRIAKRIIISTKNTSISHLQRKMRISYNDAKIVIDKISKIASFRKFFIKRYLDIIMQNKQRILNK